MFCAKFQALYSEQHLLALSRSCGFIKRKRKLTPLAFINTLMFHAYTNDLVSLNDHIIDLNKNDQIVLSRQSLDQRFTQEAVEFVKQLVEKQYQTQFVDQSLKDEILSGWDNVYLHDSSQFVLPDHMSSHFKGYGGATKSNAVLKIQHGYELKSGKLFVHQIADARSQDVTSGKQGLGSYQQNDLVLRDMGYFDLESFKSLHQNKTNYISRLKPKTTIYDLNGEEMDMGNLARKMKMNNIPFIDKQVIIGTKKPVETHIIITLAPEQVRQERIRKANRQNKSYGNQTSAKFKQYASLNIFITNVDEKLHTGEQAMKLYRLRWQIELVFKAWKSYYKIDCIKQCNYHRTLCYVYACLLLILTNWEICSCFMSLGYLQMQKPLSVLKVMKALLQYKDDQRKWCARSSNLIADQIREMFKNITQNTVRETRENRHNYMEIIDLIN